MNELRYTLMSEGTSDRRLIPHLTWLLRESGIRCPIQPEWADLARLSRRPPTFARRIMDTLRLYPCDLLFVHRDSDGESREKRVAEIQEAASEVVETSLVCVVPVRMQEAWLLFDEGALRRAAGNPFGRHPLSLPPLARLEDLPDPKSKLNDLLREASGLTGRRRHRLHVSKYAYRVAELIDNFAPLRCLPAFTALEADIRQVVQAQGWDLWL